MEASVSEQELSMNDQNATPASYELGADEAAQLKTLDENLVKFEGLKRWSDVLSCACSSALSS